MAVTDNQDKFHFLSFAVVQGDKTSRSCFFLQLTKSAEICIKTR